MPSSASPTGSLARTVTSSKLATFDVSFPKRAADDANGATSPEALAVAAAWSAVSVN